MSERRSMVILKDRLKRSVWPGIFALKQNQGQTFIEYVLLIVIVTASLLAMQVYMKRGVQSAVKVAADQLGAQEPEEVDPKKGTKTKSTTRTLTTGNQTTLSFRKGIYGITVDSVSETEPGAKSVYRIEE